MKIGIDISQIIYQGAGVAAYTQNLVRELVATDKDNKYVLFGSSLRQQHTLLSYIKELPNGSSFSAKIFSLPPTLLNIIWNKLHILPIENFTGKLDLFHTSDWTEPPAHAKKITTIHDLVVYKYPEFLNQKIISTQKAKLEWVQKESDMVIADSQSTKEDIIEYLKIPSEKIAVVYLGIGTEFFPQKIDSVLAIKKKYGLTTPYILSVGTREPRKNLQRIIKGFLKLEKGLTLVIVGKAGWGQDIEKSQNIKILDLVSNEELTALYTGAACFVYPSLYEGFGLPVLEAMACGAPVVTSNRGSLTEIVHDETVLVDPESEDSIAQGIVKAISLDRKERARLVQKGIKHTKQFSWKKTAQKTLDIYKSLL